MLANGIFPKSAAPQHYYFPFSDRCNPEMQGRAYAETNRDGDRGLLALVIDSSAKTFVYTRQREYEPPLSVVCGPAAGYAVFEYKSEGYGRHRIIETKSIDWSEVETTAGHCAEEQGMFTTLRAGNNLLNKYEVKLADPDARRAIKALIIKIEHNSNFAQSISAGRYYACPRGDKFYVFEAGSNACFLSEKSCYQVNARGVIGMKSTRIKPCSDMPSLVIPQRDKVGPVPSEEYVFLKSVANFAPEPVFESARKLFFQVIPQLSEAALV